MTSANTPSISRDPAERFNLFFKTAVTHKTIWLLIDEHGSVMLNTEDEDCVPVWPTKEHALQWATGEWEGFTAEPISIAKWKSRWTHGLEDDELSLVVFPDQEGEGIVLFPDEFEMELVKQESKLKR
ncbi:DUF2750 domain-containing protein [Vibrio rarus]|uniref:DUF2750 domain-containing protein n=1 Tax=Vibrio rarus TaxID=413403 RepID=UPI0021C3AC25|nr:DUF2750 domain-containing protein [Vibrio rarus]